jgi:hypothetical protein
MVGHTASKWKIAGSISPPSKFTTASYSHAVVVFVGTRGRNPGEGLEGWQEPQKDYTIEIKHPSPTC